MRTRIVWLELSLILMALSFAEFGEVLREIRTDVVLDWFVSLAPLIWSVASILVLYAFFRLYFSPDLVPPKTGPAMRRASAFRVPNIRVLRARGRSVRKVWAISALVYAVAYALLQGIFVVDLSGSLQPVFVVIESAIGYGPGIAWSPTPTFGTELWLYPVAAAAALSLLSGLVFALAFQVIATSQRAARTLPGPLLGLAVICPACAGGPLSGLFLAYVAPIAFMGGMGSASALSRLLRFSTLLLIVKLVLLWTAISVLPQVFPPDGPPPLPQASAP